MAPLLMTQRIAAMAMLFLSAAIPPVPAFVQVSSAAPLWSSVMGCAALFAASAPRGGAVSSGSLAARVVLPAMIFASCSVRGAGASAVPTAAPTISPTTAVPTAVPSTTPTAAPTPPTSAPTKAPTAIGYTYSPTSVPTTAPTAAPTTAGPTVAPSTAPTSAPSTSAPSIAPTSTPTKAPTATGYTYAPTTTPTFTPTSVPTNVPTATPTAAPTPPTSAPTKAPTTTGYTYSPTSVPTVAPTSVPTSAPSATPTSSPTFAPTLAPTGFPTGYPTGFPTQYPTQYPTGHPSVSPTNAPTKPPTSPTAAPTYFPSTGPPVVVIDTSEADAAAEATKTLTGATIGVVCFWVATVGIVAVIAAIVIVVALKMNRSVASEDDLAGSADECSAGLELGGGGVASAPALVHKPNEKISASMKKDTGVGATTGAIVVGVNPMPRAATKSRVVSVRVDVDGGVYSKEDFVAHYGNADQWNHATRTSVGGSVTSAQLAAGGEHNADDDAAMRWSSDEGDVERASATSTGVGSSRPVSMRADVDGGVYSREDFVAHYGNADQWDHATRTSVGSRSNAAQLASINETRRSSIFDLSLSSDEEAPAAHTHEVIMF